jgi:hypothetical protein
VFHQRAGDGGWSLVAIRSKAALLKRKLKPIRQPMQRSGGSKRIIDRLTRIKSKVILS